MPDKYFIDVNGEINVLLPAQYEQRPVRFPVELLVHSDGFPAFSYNRFALNSSKASLLVETPDPFPLYSPLRLNFYIPPTVKTLGEFSGRVVWTNTTDRKRFRGMGIQLFEKGPGTLNGLVAQLEETQPLLDANS